MELYNMICFSFKILGDKGLERTTSNSMHKKIFWKHTYRNGHVCKVAHTHPKTHAHACTHCFYLWTSECVGHVYWSLKQAEEAIRPSEGGVVGHLMWCAENWAWVLWRKSEWALQEAEPSLQPFWWSTFSDNTETLLPPKFNCILLIACCF